MGKQIYLHGEKIEDYKLDALCPDCGQNKYIDDIHDAIFCLNENKWLESGCSGKECEFCKDRPLTPLP